MLSPPQYLAEHLTSLGEHKGFQLTERFIPRLQVGRRFLYQISAEAGDKSFTVRQEGPISSSGDRALKEAWRGRVLDEVKRRIDEGDYSKEHQYYALSGADDD